MDQAGWRVAEYDHKCPVALIEYKDRHARLDIYDANNTTLSRLADMAGLPFFIVVYDKERLKFGVVPRNERAEDLLPEKTIYNEVEYVEFLHRVRCREMPEWFKEKLKGCER